MGLSLHTDLLTRRNLETPQVLLAAVEKARVLEAAPPPAQAAVLALAGFRFRRDRSRVKVEDLVNRFVYNAESSSSFESIAEESEVVFM
jgi:hypothetical protein